MTPEEGHREPRDEEEAAAFKGVGHAITIIRERRSMTRDELASKSNVTVAELARIERGDFDEWWGDLRLIAQALERSVGALLIEAEEFAPGPGGERWRQISGEAESGSPIPGPRSDAAESRKQA